MEDARSRLVAAIAASAALHWVLIFGITVRAPEPSIPPLVGRLQTGPSPLADSPSPASVARRPEPTVPPTPPGMSSVRGAPLMQVAAIASAQQATEALPATLPAPPPDSALPSVAMPLLSDPTWYTAAQLDVYPRALGPMRPVYPEQAAALGIGGEVTLLVMVDERGAVEEVSAAEAAPEGYFEAAAVAALRAIRFDPARKDDRSVRSRILIKVSFDPAARDRPANSAAR